MEPIYMSRYSDYHGYWLFGFLVSDHQHLCIDLISEQVYSAEGTPEATAVALARTKFYEQVAKAGLSFNSVRAAELEIIRMPGIRKGLQNFFFD